MKQLITSASEKIRDAGKKKEMEEEEEEEE